VDNLFPFFPELVNVIAAPHGAHEYADIICAAANSLSPDNLAVVKQDPQIIAAVVPFDYLDVILAAGSPLDCLAETYGVSIKKMGTRKSMGAP